jgi:hypothetical protein
MKIRTGLIHALRRDSDPDIFNEVLFLDSDQFSTMTGLAHSLTSGQEIY